MNIYRKYIKRFFDLLISLISLIILSPILLLLSFLIKIFLGSPILFKQERPGLNEKVFIMYKFRTMNDERNEKGELLPDSQRLTNFGKFLRTTSLDELPELFNVFKGDMSIIGPRPLLVRYLPYYTDRERLRHSVRPGLTGLAQINGRNSLGWEDRITMDVQYVQNLSFHLDMKIILKTIIKVIKREGVVIIDDIPLKDLDIERSSRNDTKRIAN